jgi:hypothetical protein
MTRYCARRVTPRKAQRMMRLPAGTSEALAHADRVNDQMAAALALLADRHLAPLGAAA